MLLTFNFCESCINVDQFAELPNISGEIRQLRILVHIQELQVGELANTHPKRSDSTPDERKLLHILDHWPVLHAKHHPRFKPIRRGAIGNNTLKLGRRYYEGIV